LETWVLGMVWKGRAFEVKKARKVEKEGEALKLFLKYLCFN
jgi:hypothetical protein